MLPPFDEYGNLPPGIHTAPIAEVIHRFGRGSAEREVEIRELIALVAWAKRHGVRRLILNGSFVTSKREPNDVDLALLPAYGNGSEDAMMELDRASWPFLHIFVAADEADLASWVTEDFGTDRDGRSKGVVEVIL
jgi:hypothetical protein